MGCYFSEKKAEQVVVVVVGVDGNEFVFLRMIEMYLDGSLSSAPKRDHSMVQVSYQYYLQLQDTRKPHCQIAFLFLFSKRKIIREAANLLFIMETQAEVIII